MNTYHGFIDIYCERMDGTLWAEPLNAVSNCAFLIAALMMEKLIKGSNAPDFWFFAFATAAIGVGSFLFHTFATPWAMALDVVPILVYQVGFLALYGRRIMALSTPRLAMLVLGFLAFGHTMNSLPNDWLNGSLGYVPALVFLFGYAVYHFQTRKVEPAILFWAAGIFAISLAFRSVDQALCGILPFGVHYIWHVLNAVVLYLTARAYILNR